MGYTKTRNNSFSRVGIGDANSGSAQNRLPKEEKRQLQTYTPRTTPVKSTAGISVDSMSALGVSALWKGVKIISDALSNAEYRVMRQTDTRDEEEVLNHPLMRLVRYGPNPYMTWSRYIKTLVMQTLLWGYSCSYIKTASNGDVAYLIPIRPELLRFIYRKDKPLLIPELDDDPSKELEFYVFEDFQARRYPAYEILYVLGESLDGILPISPIGLFADTIGLNLAAKRYGSKSLYDDTTPKVVLETPKEVSILGEDVLRLDANGDPIQDDSGNDLYISRAQAIEESWKKAHGRDGERGLAMLDGGVTAKYISMPAEDRQFLETQSFGVREIARILNIPSTKLGDEKSSTYNNVTADDMTFVKDTLGPIARNLEATINRQLMFGTPRTRVYLKIDTNYLINESSKDLTDRTVQAFKSGILGLSEARKQLGYPEEMPEQDLERDIPRLTVEGRPQLTEVV